MSLNKISLLHFSLLLITSIRGRSSAGRALEWHSRGHRFDPDRLHQTTEKRFFRFSVVFCNERVGSEPIVHLVRFALAEHEGHKNGVICEANARGLSLDPDRLHQKISFFGTRFFYPLRKQWYIIAVRLYIITRSVYIINRRLHKRFRNDDIQQLTLLMICNSCGIDDIHGSAVIFARF